MPIRLTVPTMIVGLWIMTIVMDRIFLPAMHNIARHMRLSDDIAGATLMSMATSAPEISTALVALFFSSTAVANPAVGLGTIVGSALFQILVVLGSVGIMRRSQLDKYAMLRDMIAYLLAVGLLFLLIADNVLTILDSLLLLAGYGGYIVFLLRRNKKHRPAHAPHADIDDSMLKKQPILITRLLFLIGIGSIGLLSYFLVVAAEVAAEAIGIPPVVIALTILAGGSSIPELIGSAQVSKQGKGDMAVANALGSNVFDILVSFGLPLLLYLVITGETISDFADETLSVSLLLLFGSVVAVLALFWTNAFVFKKWMGWLLLGTYVIYVAAIVILNSV